MSGTNGMDYYRTLAGIESVGDFQEKDYQHNKRFAPVSLQERDIFHPQTAAIAKGDEDSLQGLLQTYLETVLMRVVSAIPKNLRSESAKMMDPPGLLKVADLKGRRNDMVPATTRISIHMREYDVSRIIATVEYNDGTYDPRDLRAYKEDFEIDYNQPVNDLVGLVDRWLRGQAR